MFRKGDFVIYRPDHKHAELGRVKSVREDSAFVVYNCGGRWDMYENYTAAGTKNEDLVSIPFFTQHYNELQTAVWGMRRKLGQIRTGAGMRNWDMIEEGLKPKKKL